MNVFGRYRKANKTAHIQRGNSLILLSQSSFRLHRFVSLNVAYRGVGSEALHCSKTTVS